MKKFFSKIRFLPLTIFAATLMLTVKIGDIWTGFDALIDGTIEVASASAQAPADQPPPGADAKTAEKDASEVTEDAPPEKISKLITEDPTLLTDAEIELLQQLAERRRVLESREQELEIRTGLMTAAEKRIDKKIEELKILRETIAGLVKTQDAQQDAKLARLVKIYESMKPKDAAKIFEELEMETLLEVAERMKERKLAPVMAKMNPERAREITVELSRLRTLPRVQSQIGG